jgi:ribosomal protein S18 acetylase RimI-like enzyme
MRLEPDPWLKSIFGHDVFRFESGDSSILHEDITLAMQTGGDAFYYTKIPAGRTDILREFLASGFGVVDVSITFERVPESLLDQEMTVYTVRDARNEESKDVQEIAGVCFTNSRFHKDRHIKEEIANTIKRKWVENYFRGERGESILIAETGGKPAGFLAITRTTTSNQTARVIDLIGVHPKFQRTGAGKQMVRHFITQSVGRCNVVRVGTQLNNLPSLNLYEQSGFRIMGSHYVLHAHFRNGRLVS